MLLVQPIVADYLRLLFIILDEEEHIFNNITFYIYIYNIQINIQYL